MSETKINKRNFSLYGAYFNSFYFVGGEPWDSCRQDAHRVAQASVQKICTSPGHSERQSTTEHGICGQPLCLLPSSAGARRHPPAQDRSIRYHARKMYVTCIMHAFYALLFCLLSILQMAECRWSVFLCPQPVLWSQRWCSSDWGESRLPKQTSACQFNIIVNT